MRKKKRHNALKHGVFAETTFLPGENPREFAELFSALVEEWKPVGPTEEEAVLSLANAIWRKRRVQRFLEVELTKNSLNPDDVSYDEDVGLSCFAAFMIAKPETAFESYARRCLSEERIKDLQVSFPRGNFKSTSEWAHAVISEIKSVLLQSMEIGVPEFVLLLRSSGKISRDLFEHELALDERLDVMIDRATKRIVHTKMLKQMMGQASAKQVNQVITVQNSNPNRLRKKIVS